MVAPTASQIMSEILPELGIEPDYTAEEMVGVDVAVPYVVAAVWDQARSSWKNWLYLPHRGRRPDGH